MAGKSYLKLCTGNWKLSPWDWVPGSHFYYCHTQYFKFRRTHQVTRAISTWKVNTNTSKEKKTKHLLFKLQTHACLLGTENVGSIPTSQDLYSWISRSLVRVFFSDQTFRFIITEKQDLGFCLKNILEIF